MLLINDATARLTDVLLEKNKAQGAYGTAGAAGPAGQVGGRGGTGQNAKGGAIYLANGTLSLFDDTFLQNDAAGGAGGIGGQGGGQGTNAAAAVTGGAGGHGGNGGSGAGGGLYAASGHVILADDTYSSNQAVGGPGGSGGSGGSGGRGNGASIPGLPGGPGGAGGAGGTAAGGAIYLAAGTLTMTASTLKTNSAVGVLVVRVALAEQARL